MRKIGAAGEIVRLRDVMPIPRVRIDGLGNSNTEWIVADLLNGAERLAKNMLAHWVDMESACVIICTRIQSGKHEPPVA